MRLGRQIGAKSRRRRDYTGVVDPSDVSLKMKEQFGKLRNWIDLLRAVAGGIALNSQIPNFGNVCFAVDQSLSKRMRYQVADEIFLLEIAILVIAVLFQTTKIEGRLTLVAPVFFILGLSFGLIGWKAALLACIAIWAINLVLPSADIFLLVFALLQVCFGLIPKVGSSRMDVVLAACLALTPVMISSLTKRRLVELNKKVKSKREITRS